MKNYTSITQFTAKDLETLLKMEGSKRFTFIFYKLKISKDEKEQLASHVDTMLHTPTRWQRVKRFAKSVVTKTVAVFAFIGRKTVSAAKAVGRSFRRHWGKLLLVTVLSVAGYVAPVATIITCALLAVASLAFLVGVFVMFAMIRNEIKDTGSVPAWVSGMTSTASSSTYATEN